MTPKQHKAKRIAQTKLIFRLLSDIDYAHARIDALLYSGELANEFHFPKFESDLDEIGLNLSDLAAALNHTADVLYDRILCRGRNNE